MKHLAQIDFRNLSIPTVLQPGGIDVNRLHSFGGSDTSGGASGLGYIISSLLPILFTFAGLLLLLYLLFGGISLMTSGGDPKAVASAKAKITNAFVGFILVFVAYWVVQLIGAIFHLPGLFSIFGKVAGQGQ